MDAFLVQFRQILFSLRFSWCKCTHSLGWSVYHAIVIELRMTPLHLIRRCVTAACYQWDNSFHVLQHSSGGSTIKAMIYHRKRQPPRCGGAQQTSADYAPGFRFSQKPSSNVPFHSKAPSSSEIPLLVLLSVVLTFALYDIFSTTWEFYFILHINFAFKIIFSSLTRW